MSMWKRTRVWKRAERERKCVCVEGESTWSLSATTSLLGGLFISVGCPSLLASLDGSALGAAAGRAALPNIGSCSFFTEFVREKLSVSLDDRRLSMFDSTWGITAAECEVVGPAPNTSATSSGEKWGSSGF